MFVRVFVLIVLVICCGCLHAFIAALFYLLFALFCLLGVRRVFVRLVVCFLVWCLLGWGDDCLPVCLGCFLCCLFRVFEFVFDWLMVLVNSIG